MANTITPAQAKAELARRKANKTGAYTPAANETVRMASGKDLKSLVGTPKTAVKTVKVRVAKKLTLNQQANLVFAQVKAQRGVKAAFQARKAFLLAQ